MKNEGTDFLSEENNLNLKAKAFFGFYWSDDGDDIFIKANKEGLDLYIRELRKAAEKYDENTEESKEVDFEPQKWAKGNLSLTHIEFVTQEKIVANEEHRKTWKEKLTEYGCFLVLGFIILIFAMGIHALVHYFDN